MSIYDFSATKMNGQDVSLEQYKGQVRRGCEYGK